MSEKRFWGFPRLCLCFLFPVVYSSCAVVRDHRVAEVLPQLEVKAWVTPTINNWYLPVNGLLTAISVEGGHGTNVDAASNFWIVTYHVANLEQALVLKQKLFETGLVENVIIGIKRQH